MSGEHEILDVYGKMQEYGKRAEKAEAELAHYKDAYIDAESQIFGLREAVEKFLKAHQRVIDRDNPYWALSDRRCGCKFCEIFRNALAGKEGVSDA